MGTISLNAPTKSTGNSLFKGIQRIGTGTLKLIYGTKEKSKIKKKSDIFMLPAQKATKATGAALAVGLAAPALGTGGSLAGAGKVAAAKLGSAAVTLGTIAALAPKTTKQVLKTPGAAKPIIASAIGGPMVGLTVGAETGAGLGGKIVEAFKGSTTGQKVAAGLGAAGVVAAGLGLGTEKGREILGSAVGKIKEKIKGTPKPVEVASPQPPTVEPLVKLGTQNAQKAQQPIEKAQSGVNIRITNKLSQNQKVYKRGHTIKNYVGYKKRKKRKAKGRH